MEVAARPSLGSPRSPESRLWLAAVFLFCVGDVLTTSFGLGLAGVVEANPVVAPLVRQSPIGAMLLLKGVTLGAGYVGWKLVPRPHRLGIPLGFALVGVVVSAWNLHVLVVATLP